MATIALDPRLDKQTSQFISADHRMLIDGRGSDSRCLG